MYYYTYLAIIMYIDMQVIFGYKELLWRAVVLQVQLPGGGCPEAVVLGQLSGAVFQGAVVLEPMCVHIIHIFSKYNTMRLI